MKRYGERVFIIAVVSLFGCADSDTSPKIPLAGSVGTCVPIKPYPGYSTCLVSASQLGNQFGVSPRVPGVSTLTSLPPKVDVRETLDKCTVVHSQGACSWCVAHATTAYLEAELCQKFGAKIPISEPHLWYIGKLGGQEATWDGFKTCSKGWHFDAAFERLLVETAKSNYLVPAIHWPFSADIKKMNKDKPSDATLSEKGYFGLSDNIKVPEGDVDALKAALVGGRPVVYGVPIFLNVGWYCEGGSCPANYGKIDVPAEEPPGRCRCECGPGEDSCTECSPGHTHCFDGYHAILITGYKDADGLGFQFKNSWDTSWADGGYGRLSYAYVKMYGMGGRYSSGIKKRNTHIPYLDAGTPDGIEKADGAKPDQQGQDGAKPDGPSVDVTTPADGPGDGKPTSDTTPLDQASSDQGTPDAPAPDTATPDAHAGADSGGACTGAWSTTGGMSVGRTFHRLVLSSKGEVLVIGGYSREWTAGQTRTVARVSRYDRVAARWMAQPKMILSRGGHTATLLANGKILVTGGEYSESKGVTTLASCEVRDPATGKWTLTGDLWSKRVAHAAVRLLGGKVLVAGGFDVSSSAWTPLGSAELYDPASGKWYKTGSMNTARGMPLVTLLASGKVLVSGGVKRTSGGGWQAFSSAELYDPATGKWAYTGAMSTARFMHGEARLGTGEVLVAGGSVDYKKFLNTAELYDPASGTWTKTASMKTQRASCPMVSLASGDVLIAGFGNTSSLPSTEIYNVKAGTWSAAGALPRTLWLYQAVRLPKSNQVLLAGGWDPNNSYLPTAALFSPGACPKCTPSFSWSKGPSLGSVRARATVHALLGGKVLVAGGYGPISGSSFTTQGTAELFDPVSGKVTAAAAMNHQRAWARSVVLTSGEVLVVGGYVVSSGTFTAQSTAERYDPKKNAWTKTGSMSTARALHTATLLSSGQVMVAGGLTATTTTPILHKSAEVYDPVSAKWSAAGKMKSPRIRHSATLLASGKVLVAGGFWVDSSNKQVPYGSAELYEPVSKTWSAAGSMATARYDHTATLLSTGKVLVAGGRHDKTYYATVELYDPITGKWSSAASMTVPRASGTATRLANGHVLVVGLGAGKGAEYAEIYYPQKDLWSPTGAMGLLRGNHGAVLLPGGKVLIAGGDKGDFYPVASMEALSTKSCAP